MMIGLLVVVIVAAGLVIFSGVWVAVALIAAVRHEERPVSSPPIGTSDKNAQ